MAFASVVVLRAAVSIVSFPAWRVKSSCVLRVDGPSVFVICPVWRLPASRCSASRCSALRVAVVRFSEVRFTSCRFQLSLVSSVSYSCVAYFQRVGVLACRGALQRDASHRGDSGVALPSVATCHRGGIPTWRYPALRPPSVEALPPCRCPACRCQAWRLHCGGFTPWRIRTWRFRSWRVQAWCV